MVSIIWRISTTGRGRRNSCLAATNRGHDEHFRTVSKR
ncbi:MAG: hypothetical protein QOG73_348, partial [Acetobacteraceae bacterium]|nr:hypothetical protein [Acetobacteraceae bacterium]